MNRQFAACVVVCAGFALLRQPSAVSQSQPVFEIDDLGTLGGYFTTPADVNDADDVVGYATTADNVAHSFVYSDTDGLRDLSSVLGDGTSQAVAINERRHIAGYFTRPDGYIQAYLYGDDIGAVEIGPPSPYIGVANDVNDSDEAVGTTTIAGIGHAIVWSAASGFRDLGAITDRSGSGRTINNTGQVAGTFTAVADPYFPLFHAFRYTDGDGLLDLGTLAINYRASSVAWSMNADGDVVGYSDDPLHVRTRAFLYSDGGGLRDLGTLGGSDSFAYKINDNGAVVGVASLPSGQQHPYLYTPTSGMVDLNTLIDPATGWTLWTATSVNNRGTIVGYATMGGRARGYRARRIRDDSAPEISATMSSAPNAAGWNHSDVTVRWTVRDPESGIASSNGCSPATVTGTTVVTLTCTATNPFGGSTAQSVTVRVDQSGPEIDVSVSPEPNAAGWISGDAMVRWSVRDPESGIASTSGCDVRNVTDETAGLMVTCTASNVAGLSSSKSITLKVDKTPPAIECTATPAVIWPPNGAMVPVSIAVYVSEPTSAPAGFLLTAVSVDDPGATLGMITGFTIDTASTSGFVQASRTGSESSRIYRFIYSGFNAAGLSSSCTASIVVPHNLDP